MLQIKVVKESIWYKKVSVCICLSCPYVFFWLNTDFFTYLDYSLKVYLYLLLRIELGAPKICHFWNTIMHWNGKVHFGAEHCKKPIISKNALNKSCAELNFLKKTSVGAYLYIPQEWSQGLQRFDDLI